MCRPLSPLLFLPLFAPAAAAQMGRTSLATLAWDGSSIAGNSGGRMLSADGRYLLFVTDATNVVPNDTNGVGELFLRDLQTGAIERATPLAGGGQPTSSTDGLMTPDARFVLFGSLGSDFVPGDSNGHNDLFVRDRQTGAIENVSVSSGGAQADGDSYRGTISDDGRFVAFESMASNLVSPPTTAPISHVYLRDRQLGTTVLLDQSSQGVRGDWFAHFPQVSADGHCVAFGSKASNLLPTPMPMGHSQVYVRDLAAGTTELASVSSSGAVPLYDTDFGTISGDGRLVCFQNGSPGLDPNWPLGGPRLLLRDRLAGTTRRVDVDSFGNAPATEGAYGGQIDSTGRYVLFDSTSNAYVTRDTNTIEDAFVHDLSTGITNRIDIDSSGRQSDEPGWGCSIPGITPDGRFVWFWTNEARFGAADTNGLNDTYVHERWQVAPASYCRAKLSSLGCVPLMDSSGSPSATSPAPFVVGAHALVNQQTAILRYGFAPDRRPFSGGYSCIAPPFVAIAGIATGGNPAGSDCSGAPGFDFNARIQSGLDPRLVPGTVVQAQYFFHDPGDPQGVGLTDALQFVIGP